MWRVLSAEFVKTSLQPKDYPQERLPEMAFAGRSNVGKSSLINALVNQKRLATTSSTPGRTRSVNFFKVRLSPDPRPPEFAGSPCYFVDLPGYGYAKVPNEMRRQWRPMVESYLQGNPYLKGVLVLIDARRDPEEEEFQLLEYLRALRVLFHVTLTKCDKVSNNEIGLRQRRIAEHLGLDREDRPTAFSAATRRGVDTLTDRIAEWVAAPLTPIPVAEESKSPGDQSD